VRSQTPLTDERITVREFISDLAGSARLEVLRSLDDQPLTASKIEDRGQVTRQTASKHLAQLTDLGLTKSTNSGVYELTAGGKIILCAFETCFGDIDPERLTHLTRSKHTIPLLHTLSEEPLRPSEVAERDGITLTCDSSKDTSTIRDGGLDRGDRRRAPTYAIW